MNFLDLVKRLHQECGVSGSQPSTTVGQIGEMKRLVDWTATAWTEIQEKRPNWNWMQAAFSFDTTAGDYEYTPADVGIDTTFANWKIDSLRSYLKASGVGSEIFMTPLTYDQFRNYYLFSTRRTSLSQPLELAVAPNKNLLVGPTPADVYTIVGEYYKLPVVLSADADIPDLPARFHMAIVYRAMMDYGMYEAAPEVINRAETKFREMMIKIEDDQLPDIMVGSPLA